MSGFGIENTRDIEELRERVKTYKKYESGVFLFTDPFAVFVLYIMGCTYVVLAGQSNLLFSGAGLIALSAIFLLVGYFFINKQKKYKIEENEWVMYYSDAIYTKLDKAQNYKNEAMRKENYKQAKLLARDFLRTINRRWLIGKFSLVRKEFQPFIEFRKNLNSLIIPLLDKGIKNDKTTNERLAQVFHNLYFEATHLSNEGMARINSQIKELKFSNEPSKSVKVQNFFIANRSIRDAVFVIVIALSSFAFFVILTDNSFSRDTSLIVSSSVFLGVLAIYFSAVRKK